MPRRAERKMMVQNGRYFQMWKRMIAPIAVQREASQWCVPRPRSSLMRFRMPHWDDIIHLTERMPGSTGIAHGRRKIAERKRVALPSESSTPESRSARKSFTLTATPT
jgi:hypothetical protein